MMRTLLDLLRTDTASAAVEMALVLPLLLALSVGSFEMGNLFMDQHALDKQVRDGAEGRANQGFRAVLAQGR